MSAFISTSVRHERAQMMPQTEIELISANRKEETYTLPMLKNAMYYMYECAGRTLTETAEHFHILLFSFHRHWHTWINSCPSEEPNGPKDINISLNPPGRNPVLRDEEETLICKAIAEYARMKTLRTRLTLFDFVQHYVAKLSSSRQEEILKTFKNGRPGKRWIRYFLRRHPELQFKSVQVIDERRVEAVTRSNISIHIARVNAAIDRYHIKDPHRIWSIDQTGISFTKITHRSIRKAIGPTSTRLIQTMIRTKENLDHVTLMPVVSAAGDMLTPVVVYPDMMARYRIVNGNYESLHTALPSGYLYQRDPAGVDTAIFANWAQKFVHEVDRFRKPGEYILLLLDGYSAHVQLDGLEPLKENIVFVLGIPSHTSHVTQPLDVGVFSSFKSHFQSAVHRAAAVKKVLDSFDVGNCITDAYSKSLTMENIVVQRLSARDLTHLVISPVTREV